MKAFLLVLVVLPITTCQQLREFQLPFPLTNTLSLQVDGSGAVFVAAGRQVFRLGGDLSQTDSATLASEVLNIALSSDGARLVACFSDFSCAVLNASELTAAPSLVAEAVHGARENVAVFTAGDGSFYVGSTRANGMGEQTHIILGRHGSGFNITKEYEVTRMGFARRFFGGFTSGSNAYFVVYDTAPTSPEDVRNIRIMRVCDDGGFDALYERSIGCGASIGANTDVAGASIIDNFTGTPGSALVLGQGRPMGLQNYVCLFTINDIDADMYERYSTCVTNRNVLNDIEVAWNALESNCAHFQAMDMCSFNLPLDNVERPSLVTYGAVRVREVNRDFLTASVAVVIDSASFIFSAYERENLEEYYVSVLDFTGYTGLAPLIPSNAAIDIIPMPSQVHQLRWEPGLDYIYALTDTTVARVPIADCASHSDCTSCLSYENPLCGWCIVENMCSLRGECQNSGTRWVQSTDPTRQCITTSITPDHFAIERPEILSVEVTPSLPELLPSESYSCHLADLEERFSPIMVPAVEAVPGVRTQYTCNINNRLSSFGGSPAGAIAFSFVSSLIGIPFNTNQDALTIYDCPAATSCSECLQTQDDCGWCNFVKLCSVTDATCSNSFLLVGAGSYTEVCPLLRPSSLAGNYHQPVGLATELRLITSNLPAPFGDFSYSCHINDVALTAVFNSGSSVTCIIGQTDLQLMSPTTGGIEDADISIRWRGPNALDHPIEALDSGTRVVLYDCMLLADSCSTCLAATMSPGLECGGWCKPTTECQFVGESCNSAHVLQGDNCPDPVITSFTPTSGLPEGGTTITIQGSDLGVVFQDITDGSITISGAPCTPIAESYMTAVSVQCETTGGVSTGTIRIQLGGGRFGESLQEFTVVFPAIAAVEPAFGPMAGGSQVKVQGANLDAGNSGETTVTFEGENTLDCTVIDVSSVEITCIAPEFNGLVPSNVAVVVHIDNVNVSTQGVFFTYRSNPNFTSLAPGNTIPVGGITISFTGEGFDVVSNSLIQISDPRFVNSPTEQPCVVVSPVLLNCTAPALTMGPNQASTITYTVTVDNAPGPNITGADLQLQLMPNPSNFIVESTVVVAGTIITIEGENIDSVQLYELSITVGGESCRLIGATNTQLICEPPSESPGGVTSAEVMVFIGSNLDYRLSETLRYPSSNAGTITAAVVVPLVGVGLAITAIVIALLVFKLKRNRLHKLQGKTKEQVTLSSLKHMNNEKGITEELLKLIPESLIVPSGQLCLNNSIGQGESGVVYEAHLTKWQGQKKSTKVAVKTLKGMFTANQVHRMIEEILRMKEFKHPHVMSLVGVCLDAGAGVSVVMPFMANGSLLDYLKRERETLDVAADTDTQKVIEVRKLLLKFCLHIARGMEYLVEQMFVHRDLAARNCMIDAQGNIKVSDFGLSEDIYTSGYFRQGADSAVRLPIKWMAVESLRDGIFTEKSDVWSYGVTMWEAFSVGRLPYPGVEPANLLKLLEDGHRLARPSNAACSDDIFSVMSECWYNAQARPTFSELVATLDYQLQAVDGYMELAMVLCEEGEEPVVQGNQSYGQNPVADI